MEIKVTVPDELAAQARARGLQPEAYAEQILSRQVSMQFAASRQALTPEEFRTWFDSVAQFSDKIPPLPESIPREWIYQDHECALPRRYAFVTIRKNPQSEKR